MVLGIVLGCLVALFIVVLIVACPLFVAPTAQKAIREIICEGKELFFNTQAKIPFSSNTVESKMKTDIQKHATDGIKVQDNTDKGTNRIKFNANPVLNALRPKTKFADFALVLMRAIMDSPDISDVARKMAVEQVGKSTGMYIADCVTFGAVSNQAAQAADQVVEAAQVMVDKENGLLEQSIRKSIAQIDVDDLRKPVSWIGTVCKLIVLAVVQLIVSIMASSAHPLLPLAVAGFSVLIAIDIVEGMVKARFMEAKDIAFGHWKSNYLHRLQQQFTGELHGLVWVAASAVTIPLDTMKPNISPLRACGALCS